MFGMTGADLPYRNRKELMRPQQLRGLPPRRCAGPVGPSSSLDDTWSPMREQEYWRRGLMGRSPPMGGPMGGSMGGPMARNSQGGKNRFEELEDDQMGRQPLAGDPGTYGGYGSPFAKDSPMRRPEYSSREQVSFEQGAQALHQALKVGVKHFKHFRNIFEKQMDQAGMATWTHPSVIDDLWTMKLEWNGVDMAAAKRNPGYQQQQQQQQPSPDAVTYKAIAQRVKSAIADLKACQGPSTDALEAAGSRMSFEVLRTAMKKLDVSMQGLEELLRAVVKDRVLMHALVKEMQATVAVLGDMEDLWLPKAYGDGKGKGRARRDGDEYSWTRYSDDDDD